MIPKPIIIDISEWQNPQEVNYDQLAQEIDGVIVRVQYGSNYVDKHYKTHIKAFKKRNIPVAVYAWVRGSSYKDMQQEAQDFYTRAKEFSPTFWWLDVEEQSMKDMRGGCEAYRKKLKDLGAQKVGVYVANHLYQTFNLDTEKFDGVWMPNYGKNSGEYNGANPTMTNSYDIHQYTSSGKLHGYNGDLDLNRIVRRDLAYFFRKDSQVPPKENKKDLEDIEMKTITTAAKVKLRSSPKIGNNVIAQAEELGAELVPIDTVDEAVKLITEDRADFYLGSDVGQQDYLDKQPESLDVRVLDDTVQDVPASLVVPKGSDELREALNESIIENTEDGTLTEIYEDYLGMDKSIEDFDEYLDEDE